MKEPETEGQRLLQEALRERGAGAQLARELGLEQSYVTRWLNGVSPDADNRVAIQKALGIPFESWSEQLSRPSGRRRSPAA